MDFGPSRPFDRRQRSTRPESGPRGQISASTPSFRSSAPINLRQPPGINRRHRSPRKVAGRRGRARPAAGARRGGWSGRWGSNPQPRAPKARARPLRHAPTGSVRRKRISPALAQGGSCLLRSCRNCWSQTLCPSPAHTGDAMARPPLTILRPRPQRLAVRADTSQEPYRRQVAQCALMPSFQAAAGHCRRVLASRRGAPAPPGTSASPQGSPPGLRRPPSV